MTPGEAGGHLLYAQLTVEHYAMPTQYEERQSFDQPMEKVLRMFSDRAYFERKYAASGGWDIKVLEHELGDKRFRIKCSYTRKSDADVPGFAKKIIGDSIQVTQEDTWDLETATGRLAIEIRNTPIRMQAGMRVVQEPGGCAALLLSSTQAGTAGAAGASAAGTVAAQASNTPAQIPASWRDSLTERPSSTLMFSIVGSPFLAK